MGSTGLAQDQADKSIPTQHPHARASSAWAAIIAWVVVIFASDLELVVAQAIGVNLPAWESLGRAAVLVLVALAIWRSRRLPYLHGLVLALAAFLAGEWLRWRIEANVVWFQTAARAYAMLGRVFLTLIPAALMALTVIASGLSRRDLFLTRGDMHAPANLPFLRRTRWSVVAPVLLLIMSVTLIVQLWLVSHASGHFRIIAVLMGLPAAVLFATINASCEEFRFRCVLLAHGLRSVGVAHSVAATSLLFGLAHFGGHPSGVTGMAMSGFFAWVVARSMLDTRGWAWAWLIHFIQDVIIFLMVLMTGV
jgi:membrane protease YdiL (CAAX protease family)